MPTQDGDKSEIWTHPAKEEDKEQQEKKGETKASYYFLLKLYSMTKCISRKYIVYKPLEVVQGLIEAPRGQMEEARELYQYYALA